MFVSGRYKTKYSLYSEGEYGFGAFKVVFVVGDIAYLCFSKNKAEKFLNTKENYISHIHELLCPHILIQNFDDEYLIMVSEAANGLKHQCSSENNSFVIRNLLETYLKNDLIIKDEIIKIDENTEIHVPFFVQHGDFQFHNLIWRGEEYKAVDLDNIDYFPFFYAIFFYLITCPSDSIELALIHHEALFKSLLKKLKVNNLSMDDCFSAFIYYLFSHLKNYNCGQARFVFRNLKNHTNDIPNTFIKTNKKIHEILAFLEENGVGL